MTPSPAPASRPHSGVTTDTAGPGERRTLRLRIVRGAVVLTLAGSAAAVVLDHSTGRIGHEPVLMSLVAVSLAATILLHGLLLGRPLTVAHGGTAAAALLLGTFAVVLGHPADAWICLILAAAMLVRPGVRRRSRMHCMWWHRWSTAHGVIRLRRLRWLRARVMCSPPMARPHWPTVRSRVSPWPAVIRSGRGSLS